MIWYFILTILTVFFPLCFKRYNLQLDSETSRWGYMSCKMSGTYVGTLLLFTITALLDIYYF